MAICKIPGRLDDFTNPHLEGTLQSCTLLIKCVIFWLTQSRPLGSILKKPTILKGDVSGFAHLEKFSLDFSSSAFAIHVHLFHPLNHSCFFMGHHFLYEVFLS